LHHPGPLLLQFIFTTCPTVCPALSALFATTLRQIEVDAAPLRMVSISIDPEHDTPERLRAYAQRLKAGPQWRFLTGRRADIEAVQKAFDAYQSNKMQHEPLTYLRASPQAPWLRLDGFMSASDLIAEYRQVVSP
jgi:protein SCO1/2